MAQIFGPLLFEFTYLRRSFFLEPQGKIIVILKNACKAPFIRGGIWMMVSILWKRVLQVSCLTLGAL
ncbi:hypothetical protein N836_21765 [Leptolyngbya sp. Heron Island J]|nr:hypothetical protein N836_21765 [Leptolyngbya sp. Heron Island J]